jgi:hypothetical protein
MKPSDITLQQSQDIDPIAKPGNTDFAPRVTTEPNLQHNKHNQSFK